MVGVGLGAAVVVLDAVGVLGDERAQVDDVEDAVLVGVVLGAAVVVLDAVAILGVVGAAVEVVEMPSSSRSSGPPAGRGAGASGMATAARAGRPGSKTMARKARASGLPPAGPTPRPPPRVRCEAGARWTLSPARASTGA